MSKIEHSIKELGLIIKKQRSERNLSQTQLALLAGVSLNFISQIESGKPRMQLMKLLQVLHVLGLQLKVELGASYLSIDKRLDSIHFNSEATG